MKFRPRNELAQSPEVEALPLACASELAAVEFLETRRWGNTPACVHCGSVGVYQMTDKATVGRNKRYLWRCHDCKKQYTVRVGTIFEDSALPLNKWCLGFWEACACKNGISAMELQRKLQITYKSALFMLHRIRHAMGSDWTKPPKMTGTVEADETFVGGKPRVKMNGRDWKSVRKQWSTKTTVLAVVERGGKVRVRVVANVTARNLRKMLNNHVEPGSTVMTDELPMYREAVHPIDCTHETVKHSNGEYVRFDNPSVHTNTIEGFFSRVKRQLNGTYHAVSKKHLHRYMSHAEWLYNHREMNDGERVGKLVKDADGKRLMYRKPA